MTVQIHPSWEKLLKSEFESPYFTELVDFVKTSYQKTLCFPPGKLIFNAFNQCPYEEVKVVWLGQDPYHSPGQEHGLSFSVPEGITHPPSLINIFKELESDVGIAYHQSGNLKRWAE